MSSMIDVTNPQRKHHLRTAFNVIYCDLPECNDTVSVQRSPHANTSK